MAPGAEVHNKFGGGGAGGRAAELPATRDVLRLVAAVLAPWLILGISVAPALVFRELYRAGWESEWAGNAVTIWFYVVSIGAMLAGVGLFFLGVWRLVWYRAYRRSTYGWVWLLLVYLSTCGLGPAVGH